MNQADGARLIKSELLVTRVLLHGNDSFKDEVNSLISNATIDFIVSMKRIEKSLYRF